MYVARRRCLFEPQYELAKMKLQREVQRQETKRSCINVARDARLDVQSDSHSGCVPCAPRGARAESCPGCKRKKVSTPWRVHSSYGALERCLFAHIC